MKTTASTIIISTQTLNAAKRLFARVKHLRCKLPVLRHLLLSAGPDGITLAATDLDQWLETRICEDFHQPQQFLIPADAIEAACRADRGTVVAFTPTTTKRTREIGLILQSGGIESTSVYPTLDPQEFPSRPEITGLVTEVPPATMQGLAHIAGCASDDPTRSILNGVFFTPEDGGCLVATDGKRLACCPATVPQQAFILPSGACHILGHPDFTTDIAAIIWIDHEEPEHRRIAIRSGKHLLITRPVIGNYPNYKQVIPTDAREIVVIPHERRKGLVAWLRSLSKSNPAVKLDCHKRGQLTLTHNEPDRRSATMQVPVEIHGTPPVIGFNAHYLADALEIGSTLCLGDELSPGICRHPTGRFCVIMPMRLHGFSSSYCQPGQPGQSSDSTPAAESATPQESAA